MRLYSFIHLFIISGIFVESLLSVLSGMSGQLLYHRVIVNSTLLPGHWSSPPTDCGELRTHTHTFLKTLNFKGIALGHSSLCC